MDTVENLENAHSDEKEKMLNKIKKRIEVEENSYPNNNRDVSGRHMMQLQVIAKSELKKTNKIKVVKLHE